MTPRAKKLAEALGHRFGIGLTGSDVESDGSIIAVIRADDLPDPNGFAVKIFTNWKSIEAEFVPDTYAGALVRALGNAPAHQKVLFAEMTKQFIDQGYRVSFAINGSTLSPGLELPSPVWTSFSLKVRQLSDVSGTRDDNLREVFERIATTCFALLLALLPLEEEASDGSPIFETGLPEGARSLVTVNRYERNPANRAACLAIHGTACKVCGFDFSAEYGEFARGYIEVHHRIPVSQMGGGYVMNPATELVPLCSNCHAAVHRTNPPMPVEELKQVLHSRKRDSAS